MIARITKRTAVAACALALFAGCGGAAKQIQMRDGAGAPKPVDFPKGTVFGDISQEQVGALAQMVADTNVANSQRFDALAQTATATADATGRVEAGVQTIDAGVQDLQQGQRRAEDATKRVEAQGKKLEQAVDGIGGRLDAGVTKLADGEARIEEGLKRNGETAKQTWDTTRMIVEAFEKTARRQGTGEVTAFFATGSARIPRGSLQERRVIEFVDWLARESRGRRIMFVAVGSASATGPKERNERLAKERSEALLGVIDQYLVNVPHDYVKIYGTGDAYSPQGVTLAEHLRYQHARLIAYYEKDQEPALPEAR